MMRTINAWQNGRGCCAGASRRAIAGLPLGICGSRGYEQRGRTVREESGGRRHQCQPTKTGPHPRPTSCCGPTHRGLPPQEPNSPRRHRPPRAQCARHPQRWQPSTRRSPITTAGGRRPSIKWPHEEPEHPRLSRATPCPGRASCTRTAKWRRQPKENGCHRAHCHFPMSCYRSDLRNWHNLNALRHCGQRKAPDVGCSTPPRRLRHPS